MSKHGHLQHPQTTRSYLRYFLLYVLVFNPQESDADLFGDVSPLSTSKHTSMGIIHDSNQDRVKARLAMRTRVRLATPETNYIESGDDTSDDLPLYRLDYDDYDDDNNSNMDYPIL